jgi:hypothetical protein
VLEFAGHGKREAHLMGANVISWKRIRRLNERLGTDFIHAAVWSHADWRQWLCVRHDGSAAWVNIQSGVMEPCAQDDPSCSTTTISLLRTREVKPWTNTEWLDELDARFAEVSNPPGPASLPVTEKG